MAVDMFMKITGPDIKAESKDNSHKDEIDVLAWSFGMSNSGSAHFAGGIGSGKVNVQDLSFTKYVDASSPLLMAACCAGTHYAKAVLTVRKAGGTPVEYIVMTMEECLVSAVSTGGSGGEDRLTENVTLNFAKFKVDYQPQDEKGAKKGGAIPMSWNIAANVK